MSLVVDASIWISAADRTDELSKPSRAFLAVLTERHVPVVLPDFAELEVACALARRLQDPARGRELAAGMTSSPLVSLLALDPGLLRRAVEIGTEKLLRAGDAVYAAVEDETGGDLVSWDRELIDRAGAVTPERWMKRNAPAPPEDGTAAGPQRPE